MRSIISDWRKLLPLILGNITMLCAIAWMGTAELGARRLAFATLVSLVFFNGVFIVGTKLRESRDRRSELSDLQEKSTVGGMKTLITIAFGALGLIILVLGALLPTRLPRNERHLDRELIATVVGFGITAAPILMYRKKKNEGP